MTELSHRAGRGCKPVLQASPLQPSSNSILISSLSSGKTSSQASTGEYVRILTVRNVRVSSRVSCFHRNRSSGMLGLLDFKKFMFSSKFY